MKKYGLNWNNTFKRQKFITYNLYIKISTFWFIYTWISSTDMFRSLQKLSLLLLLSLSLSLSLFFFIIIIIISRMLTWRDMQHLTVLTSKRNSLFDAKNRFYWNMNGNILVSLEINESK